MKKTMKKVLVMAMCMVLALGSFAVAGAKSKDVTKSFKDKKQVMKLANGFIDWTTYQISYNLKSGAQKTLTTAKKANRVALLNYNRAYCDGAKLQKVSCKLFGVETKATVKKKKGDWGESGPVLKNATYTKLSAKTYVVKTDLYMVGPNSDYSKTVSTKVGTVKYTITKNTKSSYGYVLKKIVVKKL